MNQVAGQVGAECGRQSVNVHAWGKFQEELLRAGLHSRKLAAAQLLAKDHRARTVSPMKLKDVLGEIESDRTNLVHGRLLEWALTPPLWHADAVGGVHTIRPRSPRRRGRGDVEEETCL